MSIKHKYIVTGGLGAFGSNFITHLPKNNFLVISRKTVPPMIVTPIQTIDLSTWDQYDLKQYEEYDIVIHAAAKTHIDKCEADKLKGEDSQTWKDNVIATKKVVEFCKRGNKKLILLSTECVFDGEKESYKENDKPNPKNWYGKTKLEAEKAVIFLPNSVIIRSVLLYGNRTHSKLDVSQTIQDKLKQKIKIKAVTDQKISFTYIEDLTKAIFKTVERNLTGIYHFSGQDNVSPYQFALTICDILGFDKNLVTPVGLTEYFGKEKASLRLKNCTLDSSKFKSATGFAPHSLEDGLRKFFKIENR